MMISHNVDKTRIVGIASLAAIFLATTFMSVSFASTPKVEYLININVTCNNVSFCGGPKYTETVQATAYAGGRQTTQIQFEAWTSSGKVAEIQYTTWTGTWKIGSHGDFITSGLNTTTTVVGSHATTTSVHFSNYDTGTSATPGTLTCAQFNDVASCPHGVSASQTVVKVS